MHPDSWSCWVPPACAQRVCPLRAEACAACALFQPRACSLAPGLELFTGRLSPSLPPHLLLAGTPAVDPRPLRCLDGQCHRSLLGGERGFLTGKRTCMQSTGSGQEEGALLTKLLTGLAWQMQDTPEHVVIVYKREGLFNLCQTSALLISQWCVSFCMPGT